MRSALLIALAALSVGTLGVVVGEAEREPSPGATAPEPTAVSSKRPAGEPDAGHHRHRPPPKLPSAAALREAWAYARAREGEVSLAVIDSEGELRGRGELRRYAAASTVKPMLLAAETRRRKQAGEPLDPATERLLRAMITFSDNSAADAIYGRVGDAGMLAVADRLRMERFTVAGDWGNAQVAAADMARFFADLDRAFPRRYRAYAKGLLGSVTSTQGWGIPAVAGQDWAVRFKGGWLPDHALVHQAAELRERHGPRALAIAVLTDEQPSHAAGVATVEGVAERLLSREEPGERARSGSRPAERPRQG